MSESIKATRSTVAIGTFDFLQSKAFKRLLGEVQGTFDFLPEDSSDNYQPENLTVDIDL